MRATHADVEAAVDNLNRRLEQAGSAYRWEVQGRNGWTCLDRTANDGIVSAVMCGTKGEVYSFLRAAMVGIDDARTKAV